MSPLNTMMNDTGNGITEKLRSGGVGQLPPGAKIHWMPFTSRVSPALNTRSLT